MVEIAGADVVTEIVNGGMLGENKGINLPGVAIKVPSLTEKDEDRSGVLFEGWRGHGGGVVCADG